MLCSFRKKLKILRQGKTGYLTLINWIQEERKKDRAITSFQIKSQAEKNLKSNENDETYLKATNGWLERFLNRHNIVSRSVTSIGQKNSRHCTEIV